jgi:hypothetical protein
MMTEKERVIAAIKRCEEKMAAAADEQSKWYYSMCLVGWRQHLARRLG